LNQIQLRNAGVSGLSAAPKLTTQDDLSWSSTWMCAALILGAAVAVRRTFGRSSRASLVKGAKRSIRSSRMYMENHRGGRRHRWWYGDDEEVQAPRWMPGLTKDKGAEKEDGDEGGEEKKVYDPPASSIPSYVNLDWWKKQPSRTKMRSPKYWRRLFDREGKRRFEPSQPFKLAEAMDLIWAGFEDDGEMKYDHGFEIKMKMALNSKFPDQQIRTKVTVPNGLGIQKKVAVFCSPEEEKEMLNMGAFIAGKTLSDAIEEENFEFDVLITKPAYMPAIAKLGKILGTRRMMPSPKSGTVVTDIEEAVKVWSEGRTLEIRTGARMLISVPFGRQSQGKEKLLENVRSLLDQMAASAPAGAKNQKDFWARMYIMAHGGPSIPIDPSDWPSHGYVAPVKQNDMLPLALRMS